VPGDWQPSGQWMRQFREALDEGFDEPAMELLTTDYFSPRFAFSRVSPPGFGKTHEVRLFELINQARMDDWLPDLVAAARERRPRNTAIARIAEDLGLTISGPRMDNPTGRTLEELIQANAKFINPAIFYERLPSLEGQVCWISIPGGGGTGFLVGPDLVLTNQHVIDRVVKGQARWQDVKCRFDYRQPLNGSALEAKKPTETGLAPQWLVDSRPPSPYDWTPALGDAGPEETDSALIRLAERVGDLPLGGASVDPAAKPRKWIDTQAEPPPLAEGNQVFLLQHPLGEPLQLAIGTVTEFNAPGTRVRYNANSKNGSSGSPCFDADLKLVALHHARDSGNPPAWNEAVPVSSLQKVWRSHGVAVL
jgi:Trypsin-like peptidase domain/Effector-associated domain 1